MCVKQGLLRVVGEDSDGGQLILEEVRTGRCRRVLRPGDLDPDLEGLAVQALARILNTIRPPG